MIRDEIESQLRLALRPLRLSVEDDSAAHAGHVGARSGGGHFRVEVVSDKFVELTRLARHRLVYHSVAELMQGKIHALAIVALTPSEAAQTDPQAPG